ncbi:adenine phosphoribosyltransferase [Aerococcus urinaehominis]|uniref:Adenine phosphoribosyltransferase n=1 Tax=Aerococcus urinaehominis TaxID=128944 RepID=A0A120IAM2_9LACT|nr:adenine phosphoribosyltransferase [Aerococcus urinaehominis]AMB98531.1 adenine phosphoribosyltransferase [Aerococcus urinaehominis]SDL79220.1 adenine phosphoribosyltransferase [Aerococcus urinaehominis]
MNFKDYIARVDDFPEEGIIFRDITPLMADGEAFHQAIQEIVDYALSKEVDVIVGPEARGFIVGCPVAFELKKGFIPARKKGKLPRETVSIDYGLEYGQSTLQIHKDDIKAGQKVLVVDDLLATGGTIGAIVDLLTEMGAEVVGAAFLIELDDLKGREKIPNTEVVSILHY